jgi:hypothetical protein
MKDKAALEEMRAISGGALRVKNRLELALSCLEQSTALEGAE